MGRFTTRTRRDATGGPGARRELSSELRAALPPRFEAVGEALASGSGSVVACEVVGGSLARDGWSLGESLDALATTVRLVRGDEPDFADTRALAVAWSDSMLGYVNGLSCADPLTGLSSLAHLRSRVADAYRGERAAGTSVRDSHALVVVAAPPAPVAGEGGEDVLSRELRIARLGDVARSVFPGTETIGHVAPGRVVVLARRDRVGRRVRLLRRMLADGDEPQARVWIEGLPDSDRAAAILLDELTRV